MVFFDHVHVCCTDLQGMIDFWTGAFHAELLQHRSFGGADGAILRLDGVNIYIKTFPKGASMPDFSACGVNHIGLRVDDVNETLALLVENYGATILNKVSDDCAFVAGPEGVMLELIRNGSSL